MGLLVAEVLTPDVAVEMLILLPLLVAVWALSSRLAAAVTLAAALAFGIAIALEPSNRVTLILIGLTVFATTFVARLYAIGLASLISGSRHALPNGSANTAPTELARAGGSGVGESLTRRELEVAGLASEGYTAVEIGFRLHISSRTVESHLAGVYSKLQIRSRAQLMRTYMRQGAGVTRI